MEIRNDAAGGGLVRLQVPGGKSVPHIHLEHREAVRGILYLFQRVAVDQGGFVYVRQAHARRQNGHGRNAVNILVRLLGLVLVAFRLLVPLVRVKLVVRVGLEGNKDGVREPHETEVGGLDVAVLLVLVLQAHGFHHGGQTRALGNSGLHVIGSDEQGRDAGRIALLHGADQQLFNLVVGLALDGLHPEPFDVLQGFLHGGHGILVREAENLLLGLGRNLRRPLADMVVEGQERIVKTAGSQGRFPFPVLLDQGYGGGRVNIGVGPVGQHDIGHGQVPVHDDGGLIHKRRPFRGGRRHVSLHGLHAGKDALQFQRSHERGRSGQGLVGVCGPVRLFLQGAEKKFGCIEGRALVRQRGIVPVPFNPALRRFVQIDRETCRGVGRGLLRGRGKSAGQAEAEKGKGEEFHNRWVPLWHKGARV